MIHEVLTIIYVSRPTPTPPSPKGYSVSNMLEGVCANGVLALGKVRLELTPGIVPGSLAELFCGVS